MGLQDLASFLLGSRAVPRRLVPAAWAGRGVRILAYHRVRDDDPARFPFDPDLISATTAQFRQQMRYLARHFELLTFADLRRCDADGRPWPERGAIVTFDDGYLDNYTHAYPVLRELGLPATVFLATGHVGGHAPFWWDRIAWCLFTTRRSQVALPQVAPCPFPLRSVAQRRAATRRILEWIKEVPEAVKANFLAGLNETFEVDDRDMPAERQHLTWEQVREMADYGIEFGAHTVTHPVLTKVAQEQLERELRESKAELERRLDAEAIAFSYPVGPMGKRGGAVRRAVGECGFRYAASYVEAMATRQSDRLAMPRIPADALSMRAFRSKLTFAGLLLPDDPGRSDPADDATTESTGVQASPHTA